MNRIAIAVIAFLSLSTEVFAQGQTQGQTNQPKTKGTTGMTGNQNVQPFELTKMGPWTRKPANEEQTKKEVLSFLQQQDEVMKKKDIEAMLNAVDFPVFMVTDDAKGKIESQTYTRDAYREMMQPFVQQMPSDAKTQHNPTVTVLSDNMVSVADNFTMTTGSQKLNGRGNCILVKKNGNWMFKTMAEPGWGGMQHGTASTNTPTQR
jgi:hypothetical protein